MYTHATNVWDSSIVQGPFSVAPCPNPNVTIRDCFIALQDECVVCTVDDFGAVRLFAYPSDVGRAAYFEYLGHSAHVTNCCFMFNDKHLITVGGADRCVFQWRHLEGDEDAADRTRRTLRFELGFGKPPRKESKGSSKIGS